MERAILAKDVMTTDVVAAGEDTTVSDLARLMLENQISAVPVTDSDRRLVGIVSEGDLTRRLGSDRRPGSWWLALFTEPESRAEHFVKTHGRRAREVMTKQVITVDEETPVVEIARLLEERRIKRVPVVRDGKLVGIVSRADLLRGIAAAEGESHGRAPEEDRAIRERVLGTLRRHDWYRGTYVNVFVTGGVVHLWGRVESEQERNALHVAIEEVPGVRGIEDHLSVTPAVVLD